MKISRKELQDLVYGDTDNWVHIEESLYDTTRWGNLYRVIVSPVDTEDYYQYMWEVGSGDSDYSSFDFEDDEIDLEAVKKIVKTVTEWVRA